jgi:succinate-acetate transporter protein
MGFATTTFVLSFYNTGARGIDTPNVIVGLALGYGGLAQFLAGMWEFAAGKSRNLNNNGKRAEMTA